jgi:hypothetical protein
MAEIIAAENEAARRTFETASSSPFPTALVGSTEQPPPPELWQPPLFPPDSRSGS